MAAVAAVAACTYENAGGPLVEADAQLKLIDSSPAPGESAATGTAIELRFNVPIAGETVGGTAIRLFSGRVEIQGTSRVDQLDNTISFIPHAALRPNLVHRLRVSDAIRGLDGSFLPERVVLQFTTGPDTGGPEPPRQPPVVQAEQLQPLWDGRCTSCHGQRAPRAGLDLSSADRVRRQLVGISSKEVALLRVAAGKHAASYLLRKLLGRYSISGFPMPPDERAQLDRSQLRSVADWIDGGAR